MRILYGAELDEELRPSNADFVRIAGYLRDVDRTGLDPELVASLQRVNAFMYAVLEEWTDELVDDPDAQFPGS